MSGGRYVPYEPPSVGDVLWAARGLGWPAFQRGELEIDAGEAAWRAAVTPDLAAAIWEAWQDDVRRGQA